MFEGPLPNQMKRAGILAATNGRPTMARIVKTVDDRSTAIIEDPPIARFLFSNTKVSALWLILRVWLGYQWIEGSLHKLTDPAWMSTGAAVQGFWERALAV